MTRTLSIAAGGACGALLRYWVSTGVHALLGRDFPYGTLVVNVLGSALMGAGYVLLFERLAVTEALRAALLIGLLGAFTTFSTFSIETLTLVEEGERWKAVVNAVLSVVCCLFACWIGLGLARQLWTP